MLCWGREYFARVWKPLSSVLKLIPLLQPRHVGKELLDLNAKRDKKRGTLGGWE